MTIKRPRYLYFIVVDLHGQEVLKFGISNKYERRFKEYRDSETVGSFIRVLSVYKSIDAKKFETGLKWYMKHHSKPILKQEYFGLEWYEPLQSVVKDLGSFFYWNYKKIDDINFTIKRRNKKNKDSF